MKKSLKIIFIVLFVLCIHNVVYGAGVGITPSSKTINIGETTNINVSVQDACGWDLTLTSAGGSLGGTTRDVDTTGVPTTKTIFTATFSANAAGVYTLNLSGAISVDDPNSPTGLTKKNIGNLVKITVLEPTPTPAPTPEPTPTPKPVTKPNPTPTPKKVTQATIQKSGNANLSNLGIEPYDFTDFTPDTTTYSVTVPYEITEVKLYATPQDTKAKVTGDGIKQLNEGENILTVTCTAENGANKTYTVTIIREAQLQIQEESKELKLENLEVVGFDLDPEFDSDTHIYNVKIENENVESLTFLAKPNYENAKIVVAGNENLKPGENKITIELLLEDSDKSIKYTIFATKPELPDYSEEVARLKQEAKDKNLLIFVLLIVLAISTGLNIAVLVDKIKSKIKLK